MTQSLDELVKEYKQKESTLTYREKAGYFVKLWNCVPPSERKNYHSTRALVHTKLGIPQYLSEKLVMLWRAGSDADPLWERVESKTLTPQAARNILANAKKIVFRDPSRTIAKTVKELLEEYDALPYSRTSASGNVYRTRGLKTRVPLVEKVHVKSLKKSESTFWNEVRRTTQEFFAWKLSEASLDALDRERLFREFVIDIDVLLEEKQETISRILQKSRREKAVVDKLNKKVSQVNRMSILEACRTLHMSPPRKGWPADAILASKQKKRLARVYHADVPGQNTPEKHEMYLRVIQAYLDVLEYNKEISTRKNSSVIHLNTTESEGVK